MRVSCAMLPWANVGKAINKMLNDIMVMVVVIKSTEMNEISSRGACLVLFVIVMSTVGMSLL